MTYVNCQTQYLSLVTYSKIPLATGLSYLGFPSRNLEGILKGFCTMYSATVTSPWHHRDIGRSFGSCECPPGCYIISVNSYL